MGKLAMRMVMMLNFGILVGAKCAVLEKNTVFARHPQAHFFNNRTMEVNSLAEEILRHQPPVDSWRKFIYCKSLIGPVLGSVDHMLPEDFDQIVSPVSVAHFSQYKLTRLLIKHLLSIGFRVRNAGLLNSGDGNLLGRDILLGHECTSINGTEKGITVTACLTQAGKRVEKEFQCNFVIGSDGSASTARKSMGMGMNGKRDLQKLISIHFMSDDLGKYLINERPGMLFFVFNTEAIGVLVAHNLREGEFVLQLGKSIIDMMQVPFYPPQQKFEDFNPMVCEELVFKLVVRELVDIKIWDIKSLG